MRRRLEVVGALALSDLRIRYGRGPLRMIKWLLDPYAAAGVYLILVVFVLHRSGHAPGLVIACAIVPFQLLMTSTISALGSVQRRGSIIANMAFPRMLIPLAAAVTESITFAASLTLLGVMMAAYAVAPTAAILWLPVVLAVTFALAVAVAYPAALAGLWFVELHSFIASALRTGFFLAPGVIALDQITGEAHRLLPINPLTGVFESYRAVLVRGDAPAAWELLYPLGVAAVLAAVFVPLFRREQAQVAKMIE